MNKKDKEPKYKVGTKYAMTGVTYIKIIAYGEGYYMCRYKGAAPFILTEKELSEKLKPKF